MFLLFVSLFFAVCAVFLGVILCEALFFMFSALSVEHCVFFLMFSYVFVFYGIFRANCGLFEMDSYFGSIRKCFGVICEGAKKNALLKEELSLKKELF